MKNFLTKKSILALSSAIVVLQIIIMLTAMSPIFNWCYERLWCQYGIIDYLDYFTPFLSPFFVLFFFSFVTFWMREEVYRAWLKFAQWWIPGSMLLILFAPSDTGGGGFGPQLSFGKPDVALITSLLFFIVSTVIVTRAYIVSKKK